MLKIERIIIFLLIVIIIFSVFQFVRSIENKSDLAADHTNMTTIEPYDNELLSAQLSFVVPTSEDKGKPHLHRI